MAAFPSSYSQHTTRQRPLNPPMPIAMSRYISGPTDSFMNMSNQQAFSNAQQRINSLPLQATWARPSTTFPPYPVPQPVYLGRPNPEMLQHFSNPHSHTQLPTYGLYPMHNGLPTSTLANFGYFDDCANTSSSSQFGLATVAAFHKTQPGGHQQQYFPHAMPSGPAFFNSRIPMQRQAPAIPARQPDSESQAILVSSQAQCNKHLTALRSRQRAGPREQGSRDESVPITQQSECAPAFQGQENVARTTYEQRQSFWNKDRIEKSEIQKPAHYNEIFNYLNRTLRLGDRGARLHCDLEDAMFNWWESFKSENRKRRYRFVEKYMPKAAGESGWYEQVKLMTTQWSDFPTTYNYTLKHEAILASEDEAVRSRYTEVLERDIKEAREIRLRLRDEHQQDNATAVASTNIKKRRSETKEQSKNTPMAKRIKRNSSASGPELDFTRQVAEVLAHEQGEAERPQISHSCIDRNREHNNNQLLRAQGIESIGAGPIEVGEVSDDDNEKQCAFSDLQSPKQSTRDLMQGLQLDISTEVTLGHANTGVDNGDLEALMLAEMEAMDDSQPLGQAFSANLQAGTAGNNPEVCEGNEIGYFKTSVQHQPDVPAAHTCVERQEQIRRSAPHLDTTEQPRSVADIPSIIVNQLPSPPASPREKEAAQDNDSHFDEDADLDSLFEEEQEDTFDYKAPVPVPVVKKPKKIHPPKERLGTALLVHIAAQKAKAEAAAAADAAMAEMEIDESDRESEEEAPPSATETCQVPQSHVLAELESEEESEEE